MITSISLLLSLSTVAQAKDIALFSPDKNIKVTISDDAHANYSVAFKGEDIIAPSKLGLDYQNTHRMGPDFKIISQQSSSHDATWEQPWGEKQTIRDHHNATTVVFRHERDVTNTFSVTFKVFNDGIGFRYEVPEQKGLAKQINITNELTEFNVEQTNDAAAWWIPARDWNRYEYIYTESTLEQARHVHTPFTFKLKSGTHVSIHEAALVDYAGMTLKQGRSGMLKADLTPWSDGILVKKTGAFNTPWRTIQIGENAASLINSSLILNLNEPNKLGDVSWVNPGKYMGIWWGMHINENTWGSGEKHGATTAETKRYMDFAQKHGFSGVLVEGWNIGWDGDWFHNGDIFRFTQAYPDFDIDAIGAHAKKTGVKLVGHHETSGNVSNYRNQMEAAFKLYQKHGVEQIKTGYVADGGNIKRVDENGVAHYEWHDGQYMVNEYLYNIKLAAKYGISINTHEPIKDTGLRRTYPNWISREGARGQEYNAWGSPPNPPSHAAILPFTRMLSGPMDFTPGTFDMSFNGLGADTNRPQTTLAKQLALYVVIYSPIQMASDLPRNYEANLPAFQFIKDVAVDFKDSIAVAGEVGEFVAIARADRHSNDWYLGALTNEKARSLSVALDFLDNEKRYTAQIYRDGDNANWIDKPYDIVIEEKIVKASDTLTLNMATSGGFAIRFVAID
ncbi:glycoside hydrolase family 97 protein [Thalassotalea agarivorans]|uniref:glycoside hydrolase family 97 protein n=1 Tax=Thalassotalea agarivorans TaxID=349064 RepID=UPI000B841DA7|nr:glycoside hydrolase family 97 protein [Thalassotalea agarivorans]